MSYQVLLVEERIADAELIQEALRQSSVSCSVTHVRRLADALQQSLNARFDAVLLNLTLSDSRGLDTYVAMRSHASSLPLILITNSTSHDVTLEAVKKGAQDYLRIDEISPSVLGKALLYAIERKRHEHDLRTQKEFYENLLREANVWVEALDRQGNVILWNKGAEKISGYGPESILASRNRWEYLYPDAEKRREMIEQYEILLQNERGIRDFETDIRTASGEHRVISWNSTIIRGNANEVMGCMLVGNDVTDRRNANDGILESEQRFRILSEMTSDYAYSASIDDDGHIVTRWVEGAFERITGYAPGEIIGLPDAWLRVLVAKELPKPDEFLRDCEKGPSVFQYRIHRKDGSIRWLRDNIHPTFDKQTGRLVGILGAVKDISAEKAARESERLAKHTLDALINSTQDYALLLATDGTVLTVGATIADFFGKTPDEMAGANLTDYFPADFPEERRERLLRLCHACEVIEYTTEFQDRHIRVRGTPVLDGNGAPTMVVVFARDVTDEIRGQDTLRREEEKFRGIIENSTDGIVLMDNSGRIIEWNPSMERITGITKPEALSLFYWDVQFRMLPEKSRQDAARLDEIKKETQEYLETGNPDWLHRLFQQWIQQPDGERRFIEMVSFRVNSSFGTLTGSVTRDITEIKLAEQDVEEKNRLLGEQNAELRERNEELDTFTHSVAHDLKNPLSLILGYADMVQFEGGEFSVEELTDYMSSILFNGRKMIAIINSLLLLASVREEDVDFNRIEMQQIVSDALRRLQKQINDNRSTIILPDEWFVPRGYAPWIEEVWVNYIGNAVKYGGKGCHVSITAEKLPDGMLRYSVADNGPGIPAHRLGELFQPFTRLAQAKIEGHGLGLSIVKRIIEKTGGEVDVVSEEGRGSTFSFTLPAAEAGR
ncbi:MAG: PAS domain S-box protein [Bacteroidetes bacterium]|nr:PAS domain S-box protein [Bacteroidota bacterium]